MLAGLSLLLYKLQPLLGLSGELLVLLVEDGLVQRLAPFVKVVQVDRVCVHVAVRVLRRDLLDALRLRPFRAHELNDAVRFLFLKKLKGLLLYLMGSLAVDQCAKANLLLGGKCWLWGR